MIHLHPKRASRVEYLLQQSAQGNHVLFEVSRVRCAFARKGASELSVDEAYQVEHHIERLLEEPSLDSQRAYLEALDDRTYEWVVRAYFSILESSITTPPERLH